MTNSSASVTPSRPTPNWPSIIQLVFSAIAALLLWGIAGIFALTGISEFFTSGTGSTISPQPFMVAGSLAFVGALVAPSAWYAWRHLVHPETEPVSRPEPRYYGLILTAVVLVVVGGALLLGNWAAQNDHIAWFILPPLNIIATGLPALWVIYFGTRGLLPNKPRYTWGVFASGLILGPLIILVLELILLLVVGIIAVLWIMLNPSLSPYLSNLTFPMQNGVPDTQAIINHLLPLLLNPVVIFLGFATISVLVPIIEESLKPLGVWFLSGQKITPAQGFGFGVLSGAAFGLFENLGNTSSAGAGWALLATSRISTLLLHSFTAGLVGWALASAWTQRRYLRLGLSFTIAVSIHGLWNGLAVLSAAASLEGVTSVPLPAWLPQIGTLATVGIFTLGLLVLVSFFAFNSVLRRSVIAPAPPMPGAGEPSYVPIEPQPAILDDASLPATDDISSIPNPPNDNPPSSETIPQNLQTSEDPPPTTDTRP